MYRLELLITKISVRWLEHDSTNRWLIQLFSYLSVTQQWIIICYLSKLFAKLRCKVVKFGLLYCKVKTVSSVLDSYQCMLVLYAKTSNKGDIDVKTLKWFFQALFGPKRIIICNMVLVRTRQILTSLFKIPYHIGAAYNCKKTFDWIAATSEYERQHLFIRISLSRYD